MKLTQYQPLHLKMVWLHNLVIGSGSSTAPSITLRKTGNHHYLQEKAVEQKPICSKIQDTHGSCMIKNLLVHHSYLGLKHRCFPQLILYLFFFKRKEASLRVYRCGKLMFFSNNEAKILWYPCLKKRLSENPFYSANNLKRHTLEEPTRPI